MRYVYPAVFTKDNDGYQVEVPSLPGLVTFGESLPDALDMAQDAVEMWLWDAENKNEKIPEPIFENALSSLPVVNADRFVNLVYADTDRYRRENDTRAVKKTLTIPQWLNVKAEKANAPFSQILQEGLKTYLGINNH